MVGTALCLRARRGRRTGPRLCPPYEGRLIPRHALRLQLIQIILPVARLVAAELEQVVPGEDAGRVHVVEGEPRGVIADRVDLEDRDLALARYGLALVRRMALHLGARAFDAQVFGRQRKAFAALEADRQGAPVLRQAQLGRPGSILGT